MSKKPLILLSAVLTIGIFYLLLTGNNLNSTQVADNNNVTAVSQENGTQKIKIMARGGYTPNQITAKANKDTVLQLETKGTYDCSSSVSIPKLSYVNNLPATGVTNIQIPANMAQDSLEILCGMGMYRATINFES